MNVPCLELAHATWAVILSAKTLPRGYTVRDTKDYIKLCSQKER